MTDNGNAPPARGRHERWRRSTETLSTSPSDLPAVLADFVGLLIPTGALATSLIVQTFDALDELVPIGEVELKDDLVDATASLGYDTIPPIPPQITAAQSRIKDAISRLAPTELQCAADELGLQPATLEWGIGVTVIREHNLTGEKAAELLKDVDFDEVGYPDADPDSDAHEAENGAHFKATVAAAADFLRTQQPIDWQPIHIASLQCGVALHLARIGDGFLRTSES